MKVTVLDTAEDVAGAAAADVCGALKEGARTLVLAGGTTPRRCYELLAQMDVEWGRVTVLFGDERCVKPDHPDANYRMARAALLDRVAPSTVHRIPAELGAEEGARLYAHVVDSLAPLDVVLLGIGEDGHTASLFPHSEALQAAGSVVAVHGAPKPPPDRVSLSLSTLRSAKLVIVLATGPEKAGALIKARAGEVPSGMIPNARWLVDRAAAGA